MIQNMPLVIRKNPLLSIQRGVRTNLLELITTCWPLEPVWLCLRTGICNVRISRNCIKGKLLTYQITFCWKTFHPQRIQVVKMIRTAVLLFVALFGVSAVYGVQPPQLQLTSTFNQRMHLFSRKLSSSQFIRIFHHLFEKFVHHRLFVTICSTLLVFLTTNHSVLSFRSVLESCGRHVIATESVYTNFIALKHEETRNFHFYSIAEKQISFALTTVPETTDSFHAGDYFLFGECLIDFPNRREKKIEFFFFLFFNVTVFDFFPFLFLFNRYQWFWDHYCRLRQQGCNQNGY